MTDNVTEFPGITTAPIPAAKILAGASGQGLTDCIVIGWKKDGRLFFSSTTAEGSEVLWLLEQAKLELLEMGRE